ncbi:nucleotidyltransferase domain-containing protein [Larkinella rosea]|uniref:Nucleotidyltransferase domain-containing protein n=1 Tax=Larkinella rosea TaxID=2025312 RepID=A0A3P1BSL6_9BACT|nr:nucleotidyltransferase domain-containing protein [Larkinella rosea]
MIALDIEPILHELKTELRNLYGDRLAQMILFGSHARGDSHDDSDIDLLILLKDETISFYQEMRRMSSLITDINLTYNILLSVLPDTEIRYQKSQIPIFQEIKRDGILV